MRMCERCMGLPTAHIVIGYPCEIRKLQVSKINSDINFFSSNLCIFSILIKKGFIDNAKELNRHDTKMKNSISYKDATNLHKFYE